MKKIKWSKNILFLAILVMSNGKLFGLEQRPNSIASDIQENTLHEQTANKNTGFVQSGGINNIELLLFAADFVENNPELVSNPFSNSSPSTFIQETETPTNNNDETGSATESSSSSSSTTSSQNDILPIWIDGTKNPPLYKCPLCDKFDEGRTRKDIKKHIRKHTGEQPFLCPYCLEKFSLKQNLNRHIIIIHINKKPFSCPKCGQKFNTKNQLKIHSEKRKKPCVPVSASSSSSSSSSTQEMIGNTSFAAGSSSAIQETEITD